MTNRPGQAAGATLASPPLDDRATGGRERPVGDGAGLLALSSLLSSGGAVVPFPAGDILPPFPIDSLPIRVRAVSDAIADFLQVDPGMAAMMALGVISAAIAGRFQVQIGNDWREELIFWTMTPAESGERKSQVLRILLGPVVKQAERMRSAAHTERVRFDADIDLLERELGEWKKRYAKSVDTSGGGDRSEDEKGKVDAPESDVARAKVAELAETLEKKREQTPDVPQLLSNDVTPEALGPILAATVPALLAAAEGGVIEGLAFARYSSGPPNLDLLNFSYDGEPYRPARISREARPVARPLAVVLIAPQPHVVTQLAANQFVLERGTLARFVYYFPSSLAGRRVEREEPSLDRTALSDYENLVKALFEAPVELDGQPARITLSPEAASVLAHYRRRLDHQIACLTDDERGLRSWLSKNPGRAMRLAALLHFADLGPAQGRSARVAEQHAEAAIRILETLETHARHAFALIDEPTGVRNARQLLDWLEARGDGIVYLRRDVHRALRGMDAPKLRAALRELEERGHVRVQSTVTHGRPSHLVTIPFKDETAESANTPRLAIGDELINDGFHRFRERPGPRCPECDAESGMSHGIVFTDCEHGPFVLTRGEIR